MTSSSSASNEEAKQEPPKLDAVNSVADNCKAYRLGLPNESKFYHGQIMHWVRHLAPSTILLAGEEMDVAPIIGNEVGASLVETAGLHGANYLWDFNLTPPQALGPMRYDMVITQAIFEHILNPYMYLSFLALLTGPGGHVVIHTHTPGFPYHKFPIDCLRYYPDWFEAVGPHFNLEVVGIVSDSAHLFINYRRPPL